MIIDLAIGAPSHGKYVSNDLNSINKSVWKNKWTCYQESITTTCEEIGMLHYASNNSTASFADHY